MHENLLISLGIIIVLAISAQWIAWRFSLPSILFLLIFGFVAGPVTNLLHIDDLIGESLFPLVSVAVGIILFEGGLTLKLTELPHIGILTSRLITLGALVTWALATLGAVVILNLNFTLSILLGAILIVTGPTVVLPILRQIHPKGRVGALLKWEGILIDPVGALIAVLVFEGIIAGNFTSIESAVATIFFGILRTVLEGGGLGLIAAVSLIAVLRRYWLPDYLQNGVTLMMVIAVFALANNLQPEAGLVATTAMGIILANQNYISISRIIEFTEDLQVLLIGILFIVLSARVPLNDLLAVTSLSGFVYLFALIILVRPASVFLSTWFTTLTWKEKLFVSWMAPRGIVAASVASVFAFELAAEGLEGAEQIAAYTFFIIVGTVVFYSLTSRWIARRLDLAEESPQGLLIIGADRLAIEIGKVVQSAGYRVLLVDNNRVHIQNALREGLNTYHGNALSENTSVNLDLTGIGRLMALTPNNEINALSSLHYSDEFGRAEVYQLIPSRFNAPEATSMTLHGRYLFSESLRYTRANNLLERGGKIEILPIDESFNLETFLGKNVDEVFPLFLITETGDLLIKTTDSPFIPKPGQKMIVLKSPKALVHSTAPREEATPNNSETEEEVQHQ